MNTTSAMSYDDEIITNIIKSIDFNNHKLKAYFDQRGCGMTKSADELIYEYKLPMKMIAEAIKEQDAIDEFVNIIRWSNYWSELWQMFVDQVMDGNMNIKQWAWRNNHTYNKTIVLRCLPCDESIPSLPEKFYIKKCIYNNIVDGVKQYDNLCIKCVGSNRCSNMQFERISEENYIPDVLHDDKLWCAKCKVRPLFKNFFTFNMLRFDPLFNNWGPSCFGQSFYYETKN